MTTQQVRFAIFDWLDESGRGIAETYEDRLTMLEYADRAGFYCYHLAEHHGTALSLTPSPNVFLSAVAQRTQRIRLGALTYLLPLYNPLRLLEELCMLDQLSRGRLEIGVSRGSSPHEGARFGVRREESRAMFDEALQTVLRGMATGEVHSEGRYHQFDHLTTRLRPYQRPYPPLWYPTTNSESVPWLAAQGFNTCFSLGLHGTFDPIVELLDRYRAEYEAHRNDPNRLNGHITEPLYGFSTLVHLAETDAQAVKQAKAGHAAWFDNFTRRYFERGEDKYSAAPSYDQLLDEGRILVGSPATVRDRLGHYLKASGANYFIGSFAFGSLTLDQIMQSVDLFAREVMPVLASPQQAPVSAR